MAAENLFYGPIKELGRDIMDVVSALITYELYHIFNTIVSDGKDEKMNSVGFYDCLNFSRNSRKSVLCRLISLKPDDSLYRFLLGRQVLQNI